VIARALMVVFLLAGAGAAWAGPPIRPERVVIVELKDGTRLVGRVVADEPERLRVQTLEGLELEVPRSAVVSIRADGEARPARSDPNYSRLMFAPTGRPLRKGDGYFSDYELLFPGVAYGVTDNLSLAAGVSAIPGLGLGEQLLYVSPKLGFRLSDRAALSAGALVAGSGADEGWSAGIVFAVGTFGSEDKSVSVGVGVGRELGHHDGRTRHGDRTRPILMLGGEVPLARSVSLVSENWLVRDVPLKEQPFGLALRFHGRRLSADVGVILVGEVLEEGFPLPWVSVSYHFGRTRPRERARVPVTASGYRSVVGTGSRTSQ
jgi:hypothetical protein